MLDKFISLLDKFETYVRQCEGDSFLESIAAVEKRSNAREELINFVKEIIAKSEDEDNDWYIQNMNVNENL